jgi:uncharacterized membrane protein
MNKQEFINCLYKNLSGLPKRDADERISFYVEMIDDRIEEGFSEEDAISDIGSVDDVSSQIIADVPLVKIAKEKIKPKRRFKAWETTLIIVGSPIWLSLLVSVFAVFLSLYVSVWAVIISFWAAFASVALSGTFGILAGVGYAFLGYGVSGVALIGVSAVCLGLSVLFFLGCKAVTKYTVVITKKIIFGIKKRLVKTEVAK